MVPRPHADRTVRDGLSAVPLFGLSAVPFLLLLLALFASGNTITAQKEIDYANLNQKDSWTHHPVLGDPSWDNFIHNSNNPVTRGSEHAEWPVNGFLFHDPVSGNDYIYAGFYSRNYAFDFAANAHNMMVCVGFRSKDQWTTWDSLGYVLPLDGIRINGQKADLGGAPDVSVVYDGGKYHMIFDWLSKDFTWNNAAPSGIGYAVSDKPEGPFIIDPEPVLLNQKFLSHPVAGKYNRTYAASLVKRENDWMVLFMFDSGGYFSWAYAAITSKSINGPWSEPIIINSVESPLYYPNLLEYFPAFTHDGYIYSPATSVSFNRNYQAIFRCPIEKAHDPASWELWKDGSVWHSIPASNEYEGIWGQTITGYVDKTDTFRVMFPSLDNRDFGTINTASRSWTHGYREKGFYLSGHKAKSVSYLYEEYRQPVLNIQLKSKGNFSIIFDAGSPLGPDAPTANNSIHQLAFSDQKRIEINNDHWELMRVNQKNQIETIAAGTYISKDFCTINFDFKKDKRLLTINGSVVWTGNIDEYGGHIGVCCEAHSYIDVTSFKVKGETKKPSFTWLYTELLQGAGNKMSDWKEVKNDTLYTYGIGAETDKPGTRVKLNFTGTRFTVYSPMKPGFGKIRLMVDGGREVILDGYSRKPRASGILYESGALTSGKHAVVMELISGIMGVDCVRVQAAGHQP
jgi:hypothetical protein